MSGSTENIKAELRKSVTASTWNREDSPAPPDSWLVNWFMRC
jgi:hypothetical protein